MGPEVGVIHRVIEGLWINTPNRVMKVTKILFATGQ
jgi:hypothetical protein